MAVAITSHKLDRCLEILANKAGKSESDDNAMLMEWNFLIKERSPVILGKLIVFEVEFPGGTHENLRNGGRHGIPNLNLVIQHIQPILPHACHNRGLFKRVSLLHSPSKDSLGTSCICTDFIFPRYSE
jgi:hypothetical protein